MSDINIANDYSTQGVHARRELKEKFGEVLKNQYEKPLFILSKYKRKNTLAPYLNQWPRDGKPMLLGWAIIAWLAMCKRHYSHYEARWSNNTTVCKTKPLQPVQLRFLWMFQCIAWHLAFQDFALRRTRAINTTKYRKINTEKYYRINTGLVKKVFTLYSTHFNFTFYCLHRLRHVVAWQAE